MSAYRRARRGGRSGDGGAALVEFALVLPIFALMLFGMIELGLAFAGWSSLRNAVQTGARLASVDDTAGAPASCTALSGEPPPPGSGPIVTGTQSMLCEIASLVGVPVGSDGSGPPEVGMELVSAGAGGGAAANRYLVVVCASVTAIRVTDLLPPIVLTARSEMLAEDPGVTVDLETYNPYGLAGCGAS
jgi:hypothetical protein